MSRIIVFGAGGRAGRAVTAEARSRGHSVTAVVRDPDGHPGLNAPNVVRGDLLDRAASATLIHGHDAVVNAVSPASGPEALAALQFDDQFFVKGVDNLLTEMAAAGTGRLVLIGLFANLQDRHGRPVFEDPEAFPPPLKPFALAHTAGWHRLRAVDTSVDWLVITPPALLDAGDPRTGRYRVGADTVPENAHLSYADLAVAIVDEIQTPMHHRTRISVFS